MIFIRNKHQVNNQKRQPEYYNQFYSFDALAMFYSKRPNLESMGKLIKIMKQSILVYHKNDRTKQT